MPVDRRPAVALTAGAGLGVAGVAAGVVAVSLRPTLVDGFSIAPASWALVLVAAIAVAIAVGISSPGSQRLSLLIAGLAGLAGAAAIAAAPTVVVVGLLILLVACVQVCLPGRRPFPARFRAPAAAAVLLVGGFLLLPLSVPGALRQMAALAIVLGLAAGVGVVPYLQQLDPAEPLAASSIVWLGFLGPVIAITLATQDLLLLPASMGAVYGSVLIGLGLVNLGWGLVGAWQTASAAALWRYSFLADWGLALVGLGLVVPDGQQAAYLLLAWLLIGKLPLYLWARPALARELAATPNVRNDEARRSPPLSGLGALAGLMIAGAAPFGGFPARILVLRAATGVFWPLAAVLGAAMLLWLAHSWRLARSLEPLRGRVALGVGLVVLLSATAGLYPNLLLRLAGFR